MVTKIKAGLGIFAAAVIGSVLSFNTAESTHKSVVLPVGQNNKQIYLTEVAAKLEVSPGDTLIVPNREIISILLSNFHGTKDAPIIIKWESPCNYIGGYRSYAFTISNASFFKILGMRVDGKGVSGYGLALGQKTTQYEVNDAHLRNFGSGYGIQAKWNPVAGDPSTAYPNKIENAIFKNILIENTGSEGMYIGHTGSPKPPKGMLPVYHENLVLENIRTVNTGWDGVQISGARNVQARNIKIENFGTKGVRGQQSGLFFGGSTTGFVDGFEAIGGTGPGLTIFGRGKLKAINGKIKNVATSSTEHGVYVDDYPDQFLPPLQLHLENIDIDGATNNPVYIKNARGTMLPGLLKNITYRNVKGKIYDGSKSKIIGRTRSSKHYNRRQ